MEALELDVGQRADISRRKATCPFIGSIVASGELPVFGSVERPLAKVEDVIRLGDSGGGDLGGHVLQLFAIGNHSRLPNLEGAFDGPVPPGFFSLDFPGSDGAHPGDSGILIADPLVFQSGRLGGPDLDRLKRLADAQGMLSIAAVGQFIADNVERDNRCRSKRSNALSRVGRTLGSVFDALRARFRDAPSRHAAHVRFLQNFASAASGDDLMRSSGEFGLLFAFLANAPGAVDGKIKLRDVEAMMEHFQLPHGWQNWRKTLGAWVVSTGRILFATRRASNRR